ncbi:MAG TPA: chromate transporter [Stellaceae bacterium]|nr:chromate transporter [Stellaceae bacterium]
MSDEWHRLLGLALVFVPISLFSFGGGGSVVAEIAHQSVAVHGWTSPNEFADLFAISRAAPGPGTMLSALIGWQVAGWAGALAASAALYIPPSLLVYAVGRLWGRWRGSAWHAAVERGLAPIAAGLVLAGGIAVLRVTPGGLGTWAAAAAAAALLMRWPRLNPLVLFAGSGALFGLAAQFG